MVKFGENNEVIQEEDGRAILVGLQLNEDISYSLQELWGLAEAAGVTVLGELIQNKERADNATLIGKGKVEELAELCANMGADTVIFNDELSGMQLRNLEDRLNVRVIDRTILILDIFASRAISREGKLQVELAQLQYRLPRLLGFGNALKQTLLVQVLSAAIEVFVCFMCDSESISSEKTFPLSIAEFSSASNSARLVSEYSDSCFLTSFLSTLSKLHSCSTDRKKSGSLQKSIKSPNSCRIVFLCACHPPRIASSESFSHVL